MVAVLHAPAQRLKELIALRPISSSKALQSSTHILPATATEIWTPRHWLNEEDGGKYTATFLQKMCRNTTNNDPANRIEAGSVNTHAISRLRTVLHCRPEPFAAMVPATPEVSTWVVLTGR